MKFDLGMISILFDLIFPVCYTEEPGCENMHWTWSASVVDNVYLQCKCMCKGEKAIWLRLVGALHARS